VDWDADFLSRSPALDVFAHVAAPLRACRDWPRLEALQGVLDARGICNARGVPLRVVERASDEPYEKRVYLRAEMHVRERDWHDLFNVLAWLAYPRTKAALNERHYRESGLEIGPPAGARRARGRARDALTLFDESGAVVISGDPELLGRVRAFRWKELFWTERQRAIDFMDTFLVGHALAATMLAPYVGVTAHTVLLPATRTFRTLPAAEQVKQIDERIAREVRTGAAFATPQALAPLPVLGVPGWWAGNAKEAFYENTAYFRPGRTRRGHC
jgi:hypothetical protein